MSKQNNIKDFFKSLKKVLTFKGILNESDESYNDVTPNDIPGKLTEININLFGSFRENLICFIPSGITGVKKLYVDCTIISASAYTNFSNLEVAYFSDKVTYIQGQAFRECKNLNTVVASPFLTEIGPYTFYMCHKLKNLENFDNVTDIKSDAFTGTAFVNSHDNGPIYVGKVLYAYKGTTPDIVTLETPNIVTIATSAFSSKTLKTFKITISTLGIREGAFLNASQLEKVYIYSDNSVGGVGIDTNSFKGCTALKKVYVDKIRWINSSAFSNSDIEEFYFLNKTGIPSITSLQGLASFKEATTIYVDPDLVNDWKEVLVDYNIQPYGGIQP